MDKGIKEKWVRSLRSGEYLQGRGFLHHNDRYCVLGVLCDLHLKERHGAWTCVQHDMNLLVYSYMGSTETLPAQVKAWAGIYGFIIPTLSTYNDDGWSFEELADFIEGSSL